MTAGPSRYPAPVSSTAIRKLIDSQVPVKTRTFLFQMLLPASFHLHQVSHLTLVYLSKELEGFGHFLLHQVITLMYLSYMYIHMQGERITQPTENSRGSSIVWE